MALPNTFTNGTTAVATEVNANFNYVVALGWQRIISDPEIGVGLIKWTSTRWQTNDGLTTDSGASWADTPFSGNIAATDGSTNGCSVTAGTAATFISSDSGANWAASSTAPSAGNMTQAECISMFGTTVVVGGNASPDESISYSSDSGDTFTEATTGPTVTTNAISMASSSVGYAVDTSGNIWKTTNSGVDWSDTTDNTGVGNPLVIKAVDTDTVLLVSQNGMDVEEYTNSTNTVKILYSPTFTITATTNACSNIVEATNGNFYWVYNSYAINSTTGYSGALTLFKYDGTNIYQKPLGMNADQATVWRTTGEAAGSALFEVLIEVADVLYLTVNLDNIMEINVSEA